MFHRIPFSSAVRVRFAPSPTGNMHLGGLRTALLNALFAKRHGGKLILRIEDTDRQRTLDGSFQNILESLSWSGIHFDEGPGDIGGQAGPYIQSERLHHYKEAANALLQKGHAYRCFCTQERLLEMRKSCEKSGHILPYDGHCRTLSEDEIDQRLKGGDSHVIRLKVPKDQIENIVVEDAIKGPVTTKTALLDDAVLLKSDGMPTYHLASVVDDHLMQITHVIRGQEWLPSTPKHIILYDYFGWQKPIFAHLPLLLNTDRSKLSKRTGSIQILDYKRTDYFPEAVVNFVAKLGMKMEADCGVTTLDTFDQLAHHFELSKVGSASVCADIDKLNLLNRLALQMHLTDPEKKHALAQQIQLQISERYSIPFPELDYISAILDIMKDRAERISDIREAQYFFMEPNYQSIEATSLLKKCKLTRPQLIHLATLLEKNLPALSHFDSLAQHIAGEMGISAGSIKIATRYLLTGWHYGPALSDLSYVLGQDRIIQRLHHYKIQ